MKIKALLPLLALLLLSPDSSVIEQSPKVETTPVSYRIEIIEDSQLPDEFALPPLTPFF